MGIQDRDYYREKHKDAAKTSSRDAFENLITKTPQRNRHGARKSIGIRYLLYPAIMMGMLWYGADAFLKYQASGIHFTLPGFSPLPAFIPETPIITAEPEAISGGITLKADRQGHFRGTVLINNVAMPFLIDTGATTTTIPEKLAYAAQLPFGRSVQSKTAGGKVVDRLTKLNSLKIGNAEIRHLEANINSYLDEVLIGMNTLKYFNMTQSGNTMTLVANASSARQITQIPVGTFATEQPIIKRPTTIKKTVSCDARQVCTTTYSDH